MRHALSILTALTLAVSSVGPVAAKFQAPQDRSTAARTRIGVFDSRAVAVAYYNTAEYQKEMQQLRADLTAATAADDRAKVSDLQYQGPAIQSLMHYQVFSNASIPNVLDKLAAALPKVAADAKVSVIVSQWDIAFKGGDVEYVDVTDALVRAFNPSAKMLQVIAQMKTQKPIPLMEAVRTLRPDR